MNKHHGSDFEIYFLRELKESKQFSLAILYDALEDPGDDLAYLIKTIDQIKEANKHNDDFI